jgi:hypothetical protein
MSACEVCSSIIRRPEHIVSATMYQAQLWSRHTQICQSVVEPSLAVIEALVCDSQPLDLIAQHFVTARP